VPDSIATPPFRFPTSRFCDADVRVSLLGQVMPEKILADYYANDFAGPRHMLGQQLNAAMNFPCSRKS